MPGMEAVMNNLADAIESAARSIVRIDGGRRIPSTGIAWSEDVVITAAHTLRNDDNLIGWDPSTDVAVLRSKALTPIAWNESAQRVGNFVAVAGHSNRATFGIISAIDDYIDVDATLPPGFSGGPLIDLEGRAIGMNTSRIRRNGTTIPIATLRRVVGAILQYGAVRRPFLGVGVHPVDGGVIVLSLAPEGPAKKAGLLVGDVITSPLQELLREEKIGSESTLHITRGGEPREMRITIGAI
jgi:S1-C subfamily serine protease